MIETIAKLKETERKAIFTEAAGKLRMSAEMAEKDFWVCWALNRIFADESLKKILCFKGGSSLSKIFHLIERFSEDIDLILDWNTISHGKDIIKPTRSQQNKQNETLLQNSRLYISTILKDKIQEQLNDICSVELDESDANSLKIKYPKGIGGAYLLPYIKLEIGPLAAWKPSDIYPLKPYIHNIAPQLQFRDIYVPAIKAERTFWEKATILHSEHFRESGIPTRYSRHYYDLYKMANSDVKAKAFFDIGLLADVVEFKQRFYYSAWAHYPEAKPGTFRLLPPEKNLNPLREDYKKMQDMIFGDYPSFENLISFLSGLEEEINRL